MPAPTQSDSVTRCERLAASAPESALGCDRSGPFVECGDLVVRPVDSPPARRGVWLVECVECGAEWESYGLRNAQWALAHSAHGDSRRCE